MCVCVFCLRMFFRLCTCMLMKMHTPMHSHEALSLFMFWCMYMCVYVCVRVCVWVCVCVFGVSAGLFLLYQPRLQY